MSRCPVSARFGSRFRLRVRGAARKAAYPSIVRAALCWTVCGCREMSARPPEMPAHAHDMPKLARGAPNLAHGMPKLAPARLRLPAGNPAHARGMSRAPFDMSRRSAGMSRPRLDISKLGARIGVANPDGSCAHQGLPLARLWLTQSMCTRKPE